MKNLHDDITNFIFLEDELEESDIIIIPGSKSNYTAYKAAELFLNGFAMYIMPTGGVNILTQENECEKYRKILIEKNINPKFIINEENAKNTFENAIFSLEKIKENNLNIKSILLVCKSYHCRRVVMTFKSIFPEDIKINYISVYGPDRLNKNNWYTKQNWIDIVLEEIEKIGKYFKSEILKNN